MRHRWWIAGVAIAASIVLLLAPLASPHPDGLERVAEDHGFLARAQDVLFSILPGYTVPGVADPAVSTIVAGLIGVLVVFGVMWALGAWLTRRRQLADTEHP